jgi:hypothetical protein
MQPPLLPEETLLRVLRLARGDGLVVLMLGTFFALTAAAVGDLTGAVAWLLLAGAGAIALHGAVLLRGAEARGLNWIVGSQLLFLLVVFAYCALRLTHYDPAPMREALTAEMKATLSQANYDQEDFLLTVYRTTYGLMAGITLFYKGGLMRYFLHRRAAVTAAVEAVEAD